jgi:hypothetical protein
LLLPFSLLTRTSGGFGLEVKGTLTPERWPSPVSLTKALLLTVSKAGVAHNSTVTSILLLPTHVTYGQSYQKRKEKHITLIGMNSGFKDCSDSLSSKAPMQDMYLTREQTKPVPDPRAVRHFYQELQLLSELEVSLKDR